MLNFRNIFTDSANASPFSANQFGSIGEDETSNLLSAYGDPKAPEPPEEVGLLEDIGTGFVSGIEGFGRSLIGLADMVLLDVVPDEWSERYLDRPTGTVGSLVEGFTQFGLGLIPGLGLARYGGRAAAALKASDRTIKTVRGVTAGVTADFVAFSGNEEKLSDFLSDSPYSNIVTNYLQSDEDDSEFEGRMKNVAEGAIIGGAITGVAKLVKAMRGYDGTKAAKDKINKAREDLNQEYVNNGTYTIKGLEQAEEVMNNVDALDINTLDVKFADSAPTPSKQPEPEPVVTPEGSPSAPTVKQQTESMGDPDDRLFIGDESINSSKRLVDALGKTTDIEQMDQVLDRMTNELRDRQVKMTPQENITHMIKQAQAMGQDYTGYVELLKQGVTESPETRNAINLLRFKQQGAFLGVKIALDRIGSLGQKMTDLVSNGKEASDEFMEVEMKLADAEIQHKHYSIIHGEIGTGLARGLSERRKGSINNMLELLTPTVRKEDLIPDTPYLRDQKNNTNTKVDDQDTKDLFDEAGDIVKNADTQEAILNKKQKRLKSLQKQLETRRQKFLKSQIGLPKEAKKDLTLDDDPEIIQLQEQIQYYNKAISQEEQILKLRKELDELVSKSDQQLVKDRAKSEQLAEALGERKETSEVQKIRRKIASIKKARLSEIDSRGGNIRTRKNFNEYMQRRIGSKDVVTYAKRIAFATRDGDLENLFHSIRKNSEASNFDKFSNAGLQLFQSSILSGPPSFTLNAATPLAVRALKRLELAMGSAYGAFIKNDPVQKAVFKAAFGFHGTMMAGLDGFRMFSKAAKTRTDPVTGGRRPYDDLRNTSEGALDPSSLGIDRNSMLGQMFYYVNKLVQLPFQINAGFDAINKTGAAYEALTREYYVEAVQKGIPEEQIASWVEKNVKGAFMKDGSLYSESNIIKEIGLQARREGYDPKDDLGVAKRFAELMKEKKIEIDYAKQQKADIASQYAREVTFTEETQGKVTGILNYLRNAFPPLGLVIPFVNTPMQVLAFGLKRTLPVTVYKDIVPMLTKRATEQRKAFSEMSPTQKAAYTGQVMTGTFASSALLYFAYLNRDKITGSGPRSPEELKALKATGWQPNSFVIGGDTDSPTYVSYGRLDPFATIIGIATDMAASFDGRYTKDEDMLEVFSSMTFGMIENLTDKSFLRGLNNALNAVSDPETYGTKLFKDIGAAAVPMFVDKVKDIGKENVLIKESRDFADAILRKLPVAEEYVPPKRTFLGEAVYKQNPLGLLGVFNPIYVSSKKNDIVDKNIQELVHGFDMPSPRFNAHPETDMRDFYNDEGRQAYDRMLELTSTTLIGGKNLRQSLQGLFKSRGYKALQQNIEKAGGPIALAAKDPRIEQINRIISMYRRKAKRDTYSEFPDLIKMVRELEYQRKQNNTTTISNPIPTL
jgi:hypothetical protein